MSRPPRPARRPARRRRRSKPRQRPRSSRPSGDRRVRLDEWAKVPDRHPVAAQLRLGGDRRSTVHVRDQTDLAEVVAGAERADILASDAHLRGSVVDHEEADSALAFLGDGVTGAERPLLHRLGDLLQLTVVEIGEERDALDQFHRCSSHAGEHKATAVGKNMGVKLTVVGCSPAWPNPGGAQSGYLVNGTGTVLLDCGPGVLARLRTRDSWPKVDAIVITHFH